MNMNLNGVAGPERAAGTVGGLPSALAQDLAARARGLWDAYWDYRARRATVLMLEALDDQTLRDIGLSRSEIRPAVFNVDAAAPRPYDPQWWNPAVR